MEFIRPCLRFLKIAQRFNAGLTVAFRNRVPQGTTEARRYTIGSRTEAELFRPSGDLNGISVPDPALKRWAIIEPIGCLSILAADEFHDIAPPVDYSLIPPWVIFVGSFLALTIVGLIVWLIAKRRKRPQPPQLPRDRALEALERMRDQIDRLNPYQFSIRVSDILRRYVTEQHGFPVTRQTSVEFLNALTKTSQFSSDEKSLLEDFLNRCDLIKFARYEATSSDSQLLLEEATRFVKGGQLATV
jgi:hypothetical protein